MLTRVDVAELDRITGAWLFAQARKGGNSEWEIAVDGKVMRGAWTDENDKVTLFSAMLHREAVTIAQVRVPDGTNEITQADAILGTVEIPGGESVLVTLDAAHTQRETAETIGGKPGWDYLMTVKGNQPSLQREVFDEILPLLRETPHDVTENTASVPGPRMVRFHPLYLHTTAACQRIYGHPRQHHFRGSGCGGREL